MTAARGRIRAFFAASLDGFLAGEADDLSWLPQPGEGEGDGGFGAFLADVGALLMGRRTYEIASGFEGAWPYGELPVLVATRRPLTPKVPSVRAVSGEIGALIEQARAAARGRDVYVDGGEVIRQTVDAGLLDELTVTFVPVVLGRGIPFGAGLARRRAFVHVGTTALAGGLVQLTYRGR
jgi:dihydrofolate reductase